VVAVGLAAAIGGGTAAVLAMRRAPRYRSTVAIAGVALTRGITTGKLVIETDGAVEPEEVARLYPSTLDALRLFADRQRKPGDARLAIADPIDVLLAVPATALCEPTAYLDRQPPPNCATVTWATAIGARGTRRLMVVSDRAQLVAAMRHGVAQAACDFSPTEGRERLREFCDITIRFADSAN
jgi:pimeloyl-ACP methyl ester carboxylesterase